MPRSTVENLAQAARVALCVGSLAAGATAAVWTWAPEWVADWEATRLARRLGPPEALLDSAREAEAAEDPEQALALYTQLATELQDVRPGDRLQGARTAAFEALSRLEPDPARRLEWTSEWARYNEHDARALLRRAVELGNSDQERERGLAELQQLFERLPETPIVAEAWAQTLAAEGRFAELVSALHEHYTRLASSHWKLNWLEGDRDLRGFLGAQKDGDVLRLEWRLETPVDTFRLYTPPHASLSLAQPALVIRRAGGSEFALALPADAVRSNRMNVRGSLFQTRELGDAYFDFQLPEAARGPEQTYVFTARLETPPYELLMPYVGADGFVDGLAELRAAGRADDAAWGSRARLGTIASAKVQLFRRVAGEGFDQARSVRIPLGGEPRSDGLHVSTLLPIEAPATHLRLDLPDLVGLRWELSALALVTPRGERLLSLERLADAPRRGLEQDGTAWVVTEVDPWFELDLGPLDPVELDPGSAADVSALRLEGVVQ